MPRFTQVGPDLNACTFSFEGSLLDDLRAAYADALEGGLHAPDNAHFLDGRQAVSVRWKSSRHDFLIASYGSSPLLWISSNDFDTYRLFKRFFDGLDIADPVKELVDYERDIVMYCGFFVVGNHLEAPLWHVDYREGANAYSLITPLFALERDHGALLYRDRESTIRRYPYRMNEAIILGDGFVHTTEPYAGRGSLRVLVSLTFGTDKLAHWGQLGKTVGAQSEFLILPCGHRKGTCMCLPEFGCQGAGAPKLSL